MANPNTLPYTRCQDIQSPDLDLYNQYKEYISQSNYTAALQLLSTNATQLNGKAFIAALANQIASGIATLEGKYEPEIDTFLNTLEANYQVAIDNFINKSTWSSSASYVPYNFVTYNGLLYMCIANSSAGTLPTTTANWLLIGLESKDGAPGIDVTMEYAWNAQTTYQANDLVTYNGNIYCAKVSNAGVTPTITSTWVLFLEVGSAEIIISQTAPSNPTHGMIWFATQSNPDTTASTTPIIGQFQRYNQVSGSWEEMYPEVLFQWIQGTENYATSATNIPIMIFQGYWNFSQWQYTTPLIQNDSIITIYPNIDIMNPNQLAFYNTLSMSISGQTITFETSVSSPTVDLPIIISIN